MCGEQLLTVVGEDNVETHGQPSRAERAYAACIAVMVPVFLIAIWVGGSIKDGAVDTASMKREVMYLLAYLGVIFIALWVGNAVPERFTFAIRNDFARAFIRIGVPFFALTSLYHWIFPSSIGFSEHLVANLLFAVFVSWVSRAHRTTTSESPST